MDLNGLLGVIVYPERAYARQVSSLLRTSQETISHEGRTSVPTNQSCDTSALLKSSLPGR